VPVINLHGGPLIFSVGGAGAERIILTPSLRRASRLHAASAGADARVRTRASAATVPSERGLELLDGGAFGSSDRRTARILQAKRVARRVLEREMGGAAYGREKAEMQLAKHVSVV
jgi:hypothetical protein